MKFSELSASKVMPESGPIHKHDISDTITVLANLIEYWPATLMDNLLGSAGKQEISGDIDVAIPDTHRQQRFKNVIETLERNKAKFKVNNGLNCIHVLLEIKGPKRDIPGYTGKVQADLFFGETAWLKFSHFSAGDASKYKGKYRTILLSSIISATTDFTDFDAHGNLIAKVGPILNLSEGIRTQYRMAPMKKKGIGYIKKLEEVDVNDKEFVHRYGTFQSGHINISDPSSAAQFIFGAAPSSNPSNGISDYISEKDIESFEQVHSLMLQRISSEKQKVIQTIFEKRTGMILPINEQSTPMPWNSNPTIGWWLDNETVTFYHGTHKDHVASILQNGLKVSEKGRTAGVNYLALDPFSSRGYGAMSGETEFRAAGKKAKHVPMEDRATIVMEFPMSYVLFHMNWNNPQLNDKEAYEKFEGRDHAYYELSEVRHPGDISPEYIIGFM